MLKAAGVLTTEKRYGAGGNKSAHSGGALSAKKLEEADDVGTIAKVDKTLSKAIMQVSIARCGFILVAHDCRWIGQDCEKDDPERACYCNQ